MSNTPPPDRLDRLAQILLRHDELVAAGVTTPVLDEYVKLHPDLASELRAHFQLEDRFRQLVGPFGALSGGGGGSLPPLPLRSFGKYEVIRTEGGGGMGVVVRAFDVVVKREVVLKAMKAHFLTDADALRRFRLEGQILGHFSVGDHEAFLVRAVRAVPGGHPGLLNFRGTPRLHPGHPA